LKKCAAAVQQIWPICLSGAETLMNQELENLIRIEMSEIENSNSEEKIDLKNEILKDSMLSDSRIKDLMIRCLGGLLLLRDTQNKWIPDFAEPVLVAVSSGICEGCHVNDYRLMLNSLGEILSHV